jgi:pyruvate kinase
MIEVEGTTEKFSITYPGLIDDVHVGSKILLDDGLIGLEVLHIDKEQNEIQTKILNSGTLKNKKGVNVPGVSVKLPGITEKDTNDIIFGIEQGVDFIAASFVRRASDVLEIRQLLEEKQATHIHIIPKIENQEGVDNIEEILEVSDGLMVARGDLGVEIPAEEVPLVQKMLLQLHKCLILCSEIHVRHVQKQVMWPMRSLMVRMRLCYLERQRQGFTQLKRYKLCTILLQEQNKP